MTAVTTARSHVEGAEHPAGSSNSREKVNVGFTTAAAKSVLPALKYWYKSPLKLFRPVRVDYLAVAKALSPEDATKARTMSFNSSTIGLLRNAIREKGFMFIPQHFLPPLIANSVVGGVLFTAYLSFLPVFHCTAPSVFEIYRTGSALPHAPFTSAFAAGAAGGAVASLLAHPMDSLKVRFAVQDMLDGRYKSMTAFGWNSLKEIGWRTAYQGLGFTILKVRCMSAHPFSVPFLLTVFSFGNAQDALGYGLFFGVFEYVRLQGIWLGSRLMDIISETTARAPDAASSGSESRTRQLIAEDAFVPTNKPAAAPGVNPPPPPLPVDAPAAKPRRATVTSQAFAAVFVLLAGASAATALALLEHPLDKVRSVLFAVVGERECADNRRHRVGSCRGAAAHRRRIYAATWARVRELAAHEHGGMRGLLFGGLNIAQSVPATSAGFLIFELLKHHYELDAEDGGANLTV